MPRKALYAKIVDDFVVQIESGKLQVGEKLPSMTELGRRYSASVTAVRNALLILRNRGLIEGHQGKGIYVAGDVIRPDELPARRDTVGRVPNIVEPQVQVIAWTHFEPPADVPWETDADGGQALAEFAGRSCYQSWRKPNPATATNAGYLAHILESQHLSVLEHGTVTFYFTGVSRSFTHELVRHRHFSYSQLSQRYVPEHDAAMVEPDVIADDAYLHRRFTEATDAAVTAYNELLHGLERKFADEPNPTLRRKLARQAARAVLPNATETRIVVTGNYRAWRHFIAMRATEGADVEIRELAIECLRKLRGVAPNVFDDFVITMLPDGTEVATSPYAEKS